MIVEIMLKDISVPVLFMIGCTPCFSMESNKSAIKSFARGCWSQIEHDATSRSLSIRRLCFGNKRKVESYEYLNRFGRDDTLDWKFAGDKSLVISGRTCDVELVNDDLAEIKNCSYRGRWNRTCAVLDEKIKNASSRR